MVVFLTCNEVIPQKSAKSTVDSHLKMGDNANKIPLVLGDISIFINPNCT